MENNMAFIKMYSADWCYDCQAMLSYFEEKNIAYKVINIDHEPQAVEKLKQLCGGKKIIGPEIGRVLWCSDQCGAVLNLRLHP